VNITRHFRSNSALALLPAVVFASIVSWHGAPALRHDWNWPDSRQQAITALIDACSGWNSAGIGSPNSYPTQYLLMIPITVAFVVCGPNISLFLFLVATGFIVTFSTAAVCRGFAADFWTTLSAAAFALFNPWVYTETVAGHVVMILAYGASIGIAALLQRRNTRWYYVALLLTLILAQIQFFVIAMFVLLVQSKQLPLRRAFFFGIVVALPAIVGILSGYRWLYSIPYTIPWQTNQSVHPAAAVFLMGYFTHYADALGPLGECGAASVAILAILGALLAARHMRALSAIAGLLLVFFIAAGTYGPLAPGYMYAVKHIPASGLFRELYDLLAYVAMGYVVFSAYACARIKGLRYAFVTASTVLIVAWIAASPWKFFVPRGAIPAIHLTAPENTRFALFPAYQPMLMLTRGGSGADPDAYARSSNVTALNTYTAMYPEDWALSRFIHDRDVRPLASLSVATLIERPWLRTDAGSFVQEIASASLTSSDGEPYSVRHIDALPELSELTLPQIGSLDNHLGDGNAFFGDASLLRGSGIPDTWKALPRFIPVSASNRYVKMRDGWVDARLVFPEYPNIAQGLGGVATTSSKLLEVAPNADILAFVEGRLNSMAGSTVLKDTRGYVWAKLPPGLRLLRCRGFCLVAGEATIHRPIPLNPSPRAFRAIHFQSILPWLAEATLPPGPPMMLRYNIAFSPAWLAGLTLPTAILTHIRLDAAVNGWFLPRLTQPRRVWLLDPIAAVQTVCELIGVMSVLVLMLRVARERAAALQCIRRHRSPN